MESSQDCREEAIVGVTVRGRVALHRWSMSEQHRIPPPVFGFPSLPHFSHAVIGPLFHPPPPHSQVRVGGNAIQATDAMAPRLPGGDLRPGP